MQDLIIEAKKIPGPTRHQFIFTSFDNLEAGQSIIIVNDHVPTPLLNEFFNSREGQFKYSYLEEGPTNWKLKITKAKKDSCCGFCS